MTRLLTTCLAAALAAGAVSAQCLDASIPGTLLGVGDDALFHHQPLGFAFPMAGSAGTGSWTHVRVCTNGWLVLTDGTSSTDLLYESSFVSLSLNAFGAVVGNGVRSFVAKE
ncbi:MAG: hypothetical protein H6835_14455 [Planctomycetes bacterium]|nr:hypothetical protein [Planctomycetota bacterium]